MLKSPFTAAQAKLPVLPSRPFWECRDRRSVGCEIVTIMGSYKSLSWAGNVTDSCVVSSRPDK